MSEQPEWIQGQWKYQRYSWANPRCRRCWTLKRRRCTKDLHHVLYHLSISWFKDETKWYVQWHVCFLHHSGPKTGNSNDIRILFHEFPWYVPQEISGWTGSRRGTQWHKGSPGGRGPRRSRSSHLASCRSRQHWRILFGMAGDTWKSAKQIDGKYNEFWRVLSFFWERLFEKGWTFMEPDQQLGRWRRERRQSSVCPAQENGVVAIAALAAVHKRLSTQAGLPRHI